MNELIKRIIIEAIFIFGSIIFLYCSYILWAKRSYRNANKTKKWKSFEFSLSWLSFKL